MLNESAALTTLNLDKSTTSCSACFCLAPRTRFELVIVESKSTVLPLHYQGTLVRKFLKNSWDDALKQKTL